jgi:2-polyprenyl-3-methyl-5-hydroxy-6-metoxy-1,4-benzoquinol methylase
MNSYISENYTCDSKGVYRRPNQADFKSSDSDVIEDELLKFISSVEDRSVLSDSLRRGMTSWPMMYHLNSQRANLLRPFNHLLTGQVLEFGAGCGAITRYLGELGAEVTAVESSLRRAHIARARTADLSQVTVVCDDIGAFRPPAKFDAVLLIGVLDQAAVFGGRNGAVDLLRQAASLLKPDGRLFLAIENQLGLKYFAGAREDHLGLPFVGVDDGYSPTGVRTWGRRTLEKMTIAAGLSHVKTFISSPDYKLAQTVIDPELIEHRPDIAAGLLQNVFADPQRPAAATFSLEQAWRLACMNGLAVDLANSFLMLASHEAHPSSDVLAWHYATNRQRAYTKATRFRLKDGGLAVEREALAPEAGDVSPLQWVLGDEFAYWGVNWWGGLVHILNHPYWSVDHLVEWMTPWLNAVAQEPPVGSDWPDQALPGERLDHIPQNASRGAGGAFTFFGDEWRLTKPITLGLLAFRSLNLGLPRVTSVAQPASGTPIVLGALISEVFARLGADLSTQRLNDYLAFEDQFQGWVTGMDIRGGSAAVAYSLGKLTVRGTQA